MPVFFARWPDGSFSIVSAVDETDAYVQLDEIADEPAEVWEMQSCLLDFALTGQGTFRLIEMGEETATEILRRGYPILRKALAKELSPEYAIIDATRESQCELGIETVKNVCRAAKAEQGRLRSKSAKRTPVKTEIGRAIQRKMSCSGPYADAMASRALADKTGAEDLKKSTPKKRTRPR
jgi:hypothetical protein